MRAPTTRAQCATLLLLCAAAQAAAAVSSESASGAPRPAWVNSSAGVHRFLTFDSKIPPQQRGPIARQYDYVWGAEDAALYRAANSTNPEIVVSRYMPFMRGSSDLNWYKTNHPEWVVYKCDKTTVAYSFNDSVVPLDFTNPDVIDYQVETYAKPSAAQGFDAIAADNLALSNGWQRCGVWRNGTWVQLWSGERDDPAWSKDVVGWTANFADALHQIPVARGSAPDTHMKLIPNFSLGGSQPTDPLIVALTNAIDGALPEAGFTDYGSKRTGLADWEASVAWMSKLNSLGKGYYSINEWGKELSDITDSLVEWVVASYLCGKGDASAIFISTIQGYGVEMPDYPAASAAVGTPEGAMEPVSGTTGCYTRKFTGGLSIVNANQTAPASVPLPSAPTGMQYAAVNGTVVHSPVTMQPSTGMVLVLTAGGR